MVLRRHARLRHTLPFFAVADAATPIASHAVYTLRYYYMALPAVMPQPPAMADAAAASFSRYSFI